MQKKVSNFFLSSSLHSSSKTTTFSSFPLLFSVEKCFTVSTRNFVLQRKRVLTAECVHEGILFLFKIYYVFCLRKLKNYYSSQKKSFCEKWRKKFVWSSLKAAMKFETKTSAIKWNNRKHIKLRKSLTPHSSTFDFSSCAPHFHSQALLNTQENQQKLNASAFARGNRVVVEMEEEKTSLEQGNSQAEKKRLLNFFFCFTLKF